MSRAARIGVALSLLAAVLTASGASAGGPGVWSPVTDGSGANFDTPGMVRTADGLLHVVWSQRSDTEGESLWHSVIAGDGVLGTPDPIVVGWQRVDGRPDIVIAPDGSLRVFFGGTESIDPGEQNTNTNTATSSDGGETWALTPNNVASGSGQFGGEVTATVGTGGTFFLASGSWVHRGLDPNTPNYNYNAPIGGDGYNGNLATDTETGQVWMAWYSTGGTNNGQNGGIWAQQVDQTTGAPTGAPMQMPGSVTVYEGTPASVNPLERTAIVARPGGGVYIAYIGGYPSLNAVRVWRVGDPSSYVVARGTNLNESVSLTSTSDGRLWVAWANADTSGPRVLSSVSNTLASAWSPPEVIRVPAHPSGYRELYHVQANAGARLDILTNLSNGTQPTTRHFHTQVLLPPSWTAGDDNLAGTGGADLIYGGPGNDTLSGKKGADDLYGGDGNDTLNGGPGKDKLVGGKGRDLCVVTTGDKTSGCERTRRNH